MKIRLHPFGLAALFLLPASPLFARQRAQGDCTIGGNVVVTTLVASTTKVMQSFPLCTVTVYLTGVTPLTLATLYSDNLGTVLANPFTATNNGHWYFYADNGHYDARISGAGIPSAFTFGDILLADGTSGAVVNFNGCIAASQYVFAPQNPGGTLTAAITNVVTLATVPIGVNGTDTGHWLYISGGSGTAEAVLITGGTAVSGATTGTITFVPANNHSGNWAIQTATAGISETLWTLPSSGGDICVAPGTFAMHGPYYKRPIPVYVHGAGLGNTIFNVASDFPLTVVGVFAIPDDLALYNNNGSPVTAYIPSGGFDNFSVFFIQPDSQDISTYTHWPPAFYGLHTNRPSYTNIGYEAAWDGIVIDGYNGPFINHVEASFFHHGIDLDEIVDSTRIGQVHNWPFGLTNNQGVVFLSNPSPQSFYIGRADDVHITDFAGDANWGTLYTGTKAISGQPWVQCTNCEADIGGIIITASGGRFRYQGGQLNGGSGTDASGLHIRTPLKYVSGASMEVQISDVWMGWADSASMTSANTPDIDIDCSAFGSFADIYGPYISISGVRFYNNSDIHMIYAHSSSNSCTVMVQGNRFEPVQAAGNNYTRPIIDVTGPIRIVAQNNTITDKNSGTGTFLSFNTDMENIITGNVASNWSLSLPGTLLNSIVRDNPGILSPVRYNTPVACTTQLQPTGPLFHLTGACVFSTIFTDNIYGPASQGNVFHEFQMIMDGNSSWDVQGNIVTPGSGTAGKLYHWVYDSSLTKWYVIN